MGLRLMSCLRPERWDLSWEVRSLAELSSSKYKGTFLFIFVASLILQKASLRLEYRRCSKWDKIYSFRLPLQF